MALRTSAFSRQRRKELTRGTQRNTGYGIPTTEDSEDAEFVTDFEDRLRNALSFHTINFFRPNA